MTQPRHQKRRSRISANPIYGVFDVDWHECHVARHVALSLPDAAKQYTIG